jgi:hypothetical protein
MKRSSLPMDGPPKSLTMTSLHACLLSISCVPAVRLRWRSCRHLHSRRPEHLLRANRDLRPVRSSRTGRRVRTSAPKYGGRFKEPDSQVGFWRKPGDLAEATASNKPDCQISLRRKLDDLARPVRRRPVLQSGFTAEILEFRAKFADFRCQKCRENAHED